MPAKQTSLGFNFLTTYDGRGARQARKDLTGMARMQQELFDTGKLAAGAAITALGGYAIALAKAGLESNALQQKVTRALTVTTGSAANAADQLEKLRAFGKESPIQLPVWLKANQQLQAFGVEGKKIIPMLGAIQDAVIAAGGSEEEINGVVRAFGQIASKGKVYAEELLQIGERGVDAAGVVGKAMGKTSGEIRSMVTAGRISTDEFFSAFIKGSDEAFGGAAEGARKTFDGMVDRLKGAHRRIGEIFMTPFINPSGGGAFVELGNAVADAMNDIEDALRPMGQIWANQLALPVERASEAIRNIGAKTTTDGILQFFGRIEEIVPIVTALGTALGVHLAGGFLQLIPGLQGLAGAATPLAFALGSLAVTSPEVRDAMLELNSAFAPLLPTIATVASIIATVLSGALKAVGPLLEGVGDTLKSLTDLLGPTATSLLAVGTAFALWTRLGGSSIATFLGLAASTHSFRFAMESLRKTMTLHPIMTILSLAGVLIAVASAFDKTGEASTEAATRINAAIAATGNASQGKLKKVGEDFRVLADNLKLSEISMGGLNNTLDELGRTVDTAGTWHWDKVLPSDEDVKNFQESAKGMDEFIAQAIRSGEVSANAAGVQKFATETLGLSREGYKQLLPMLQSTASAMQEVAETTQATAQAHGNAIAAVQGLGKEMEQQAEPVLGMITAADGYAAALDKWKDDGSTESVIALGKALLESQAAGELATGVFGTMLPEDFRALAEAAGMPKGAIEQLTQLWQDAQETFTSTAERFAARGSDFMGQYVAMLSGIDADTASTVLNIKQSVDSLMSKGMSYNDALRQMSEETGLSTATIQEGFRAAAAAGIEFSGDYPATVTATPVLPEMEDAVSQVVEFILEMQESVQDVIQGLMDQGLEEGTAIEVAAKWFGMSEADVKDYWDGILDETVDGVKDATTAGQEEANRNPIDIEVKSFMKPGSTKTATDMIQEEIRKNTPTPPKKEESKKWWEWLSPPGNLLPKFKGLFSGISTGAKGATGTFSTQNALMRGSVSQTDTTVGKSTRGITASLKGVSTTSSTTSRGWNTDMEGMGTSTSRSVPGISTLFNGLKTGPISGLKTGSGELFRNWATGLSSMLTKTTGTMPGISGIVKGLNTGPITGLKGGISSLGTSWGTKLTNMLASTTSKASGMSGLLNRLNKGPVNLVRSGITSLGTTWGTKLTNMFSSTSSRASSITGLLRGMDRGPVNLVKRGITGLGSEWGKKMSGMKGTTNTAFQSIQSSIAGPTGYIVNTLYGKGIKSVWNAISSSMFGNRNKMSPISLGGGSKGGKKSPQRRARGGYMRGPGTSMSDSIPTLLSDGEYVVRAAAVKKYGVGTFDALNQMQPKGYAFGGLITAAGNLFKGGADKVFNKLSDSGIGNWFSSVGKISSGIAGLPGKLRGIPSNSNYKPMRGMTHAGMKKSVDRVTAVYNMITSAIGSGVGPGGYQEMSKWIRSVVPGTSITSGLRRGDPGYHGRGQAIDMAFSDGSERRGGGIAKKAYGAIKGSFMNSIAELIWDYSPDGYGVGVWNGKRHKFNSASSRPPSHNDHIHWASSGGGGGMGGGSGQWSHVVSAVLKELGVYSGNTLNLVLRAIQKESSGNPRSINLWDSNAKAGIPSKGLLQTIDPTFNAYAGKYRSRGPYDPYANIYAAVRYARSRYGSGWAQRMAAPGGYATGVKNAPSGPAWVGENGPELMNFRGGESVTPVTTGGDTYIFNFPNAVITNRRQAEDLFVQAQKDAKKHGRI